MIYFWNNMDFSSSWSSAYQDLSIKYQLLAQDYTKAIQLRQSLKQQIQNLEKENQELKNRKQRRRHPSPPRDREQSSFFVQPAQKQITIVDNQKGSGKIKKQTSTESQTQYDGITYQCTYNNCNKVYCSPVSMNLHIKMKHNGGTKKERQACARLIIEAQERGEDPPNISINLPPNFIQQYRNSYEYNKKYSM